MPGRVRITDVAPRDGLQNEPGTIPAADKVRLVALLAAAGVDEIEVSSFVSPKWVPQLADAAEVFAAAGRSKPRGVVFSALVPNETGLKAALAVNAAGEALPEGCGRMPAACGGAGAAPEARGGVKPAAAGGAGRIIDKVAVFTAASETFARKNTNASIAETLERFRPVVAAAHAAGLPVRGYVSCAVACPFEGPIAPQRVADVAARLADMGVDEIDLGDTIGVGTPEMVDAMLGAVIGRLGPGSLWRLTLHLHDTFGRAADCVRAALRLGIRSFDGSVAGLGGCPYASTAGRRAPGNIATEALVDAVTRAGFSTGVDRRRLNAVADFARSLTARMRDG